MSLLLYRFIGVLLIRLNKLYWKPVVSKMQLLSKAHTCYPQRRGPLFEIFSHLGHFSHSDT